MYPIRYSSYPPKKEFTVNELEMDFFNTLYRNLTEQENSKIRLVRMSNGTLEVEYSGYPIGKIKLQGRKHTMQVIKSLYKFSDYEGTTEFLKEKIIDWVEYIHKYL